MQRYIHALSGSVIESGGFGCMLVLTCVLMVGGMCVLPVLCAGEDFGSYVPIGCHTHLHAGAVSKEVLPHATLSEILKSIPAEAAAPNTKLAVAELVFTVALCAVSVYSVFIMPWVLLPLGWAMAGFALSHLYLIGHDCAHGTWVSNTRINRLIGEICFLPFLRSFQSFVTEHASGVCTHTHTLVSSCFVY